MPTQWPCDTATSNISAEKVCDYSNYNGAAWERALISSIWHTIIHFIQANEPTVGWKAFLPLIILKKKKNSVISVGEDIPKNFIVDTRSGHSSEPIYEWKMQDLICLCNEVKKKSACRRGCSTHQVHYSIKTNNPTLLQTRSRSKSVDESHRENNLLCVYFFGPIDLKANSILTPILIFSTFKLH